MDKFKNSKKKRVASAVLTATVSFAILFGDGSIVNAESYVKQDGENGFTYYENGSKVASLVLERLNENTQKAIVFTKDSDGIFTVHSLTVVSDDNKIAITSGDDLSKTYYVGFTEDNSITYEMAKEKFDNATIVSEDKTNNIYTIKKGENSIDIKKTDVVIDDKAPDMEISKDTDKYTFSVNVTINAVDNCEAPTNVLQYAYAPKGSKPQEWTTDNNFTISSNGEFTFYVKDSNGNKNHKSVEIKNIVTQNENYTITKSVEHNENTESGPSIASYNISIEGDENTEYCYMTRNGKANLLREDTKFKWEDNSLYSLDANNLKKYIGIFEKNNELVNLQIVKTDDINLRINNYQKDIEKSNNKKYVAAVSITSEKDDISINDIKNKLSGEIENGTVSFSVDKEKNLIIITVRPEEDKSVNGDLKVSYQNDDGTVEYFVVENVIIDTQEPEVSVKDDYKDSTYRKELYPVEIAVSDNISKDITINARLVDRLTNNIIADNKVEGKDLNIKVEKNGDNTYIINVEGDYKEKINAKLQVEAIDEYGNIKTFAKVCDYKVDFVNPNIKESEIEDLEENLVNGKKYNISVQAEDEESGIAKVEIVCGNKSIELSESKENPGYYEKKGVILSEEFEDQISGDTLVFSVKVTDNSGRTSTKELKSVKYYNSIKLISSKCMISPDDNEYLNDGEDIVLTYIFDHKVEIDDVIVNGKKGIEVYNSSVTPISGEYQYSAIIPYEKIKDILKDGEDVVISIVASDDNGNNEEFTSEDKIKYYKEFSILDVTLKSNNKTSPTAVKKGNKLTLNFKTSKAITNLDKVEIQIGGQNVAFTSKDYENWEAEYTVTGEEGWTDTQSITANITIRDNAGNYAHNELSDTDITYYKSINIAERSILIKNEKGKNMVKDGDKVFITFSTNHKADSIVAKIGEKELEANSEDHINWTIEYTVDGADGLVDDKTLYYVNDTLNINITAKDIAGNSYRAVIKSFSNTETVRYQAPVHIGEIKVKPDSVAVGDEVIINFSVDDTVEKAIVIIDEKEFEATPTNNSKTKWQLIYTVTEDNNFTDVTDIPISISVEDIAGNIDTKKFEKSGVIYYGDLAVDVTEIKSSNSNSYAVKKGDTIDLTFEITNGHIIDISNPDKVNIKIGGLAAKITAVETEEGSNNKFKATVVVDDSLEDLSNIQYSIYAEDSVGNKYADSKETNIIYYSALSIIDGSIKVVSDNENSSLATFGNTLKVEFLTNHEITNETVIINGLEVNKNDIKFIDFNEDGQAIYEAVFKIDDNFYLGQPNEDDFIIPIVISATDTAGNEVISDNNSLSEILVTFGAKVNITNINIISKNNDTSVIAPNDKIQVDFSTDDDIISADIKVKIGEIVISETTLDINDIQDVYSTIIEIPDFYTLLEKNVIDLDDISVEISVKDRYSNQDSQIQSTTIKYYGNIEIKDIKVVSDNVKRNDVAKDGNIITVSFTTNHTATEAKVNINGNVIEAEKTDGINWSIRYEIPENTFEDTKNIIVSEISVTDMASNSCTENDYIGEVVYYAPIVVSDISVNTNNAKDGTKYAKNNDIVTIKFSTNHSISIKNILMGNGTELNIISPESKIDSNIENDKYTYTIQYTIPNGTTLKDIQNIAVKVDVFDIAENENYLNNESSVVYYAPIVMSDIVMSSNNVSKNSYIAKDGDIITVNFNTNHNVVVEQSTISGQETTVSNNGNLWSLTHKLVNGDVLNDNSNISTYVKVSDAAGNEMDYRNLYDNNTVVYYKPIEQSINNITMTSSETDTNLNNGDTMFWNLTTTHPISTDNTYIEINGNKVNFVLLSSTGTEYIYQSSYVIPAANNFTDFGTINYNLFVNDSSKNTTYKNNQDRTTKFTYYAPIQITDIAINTNNSNNGTMYAKNGDTVTVSFTSNHMINIDTAAIAGIAANISSNRLSGNNMHYTLTYMVTQGTLSDLSVIPFVFTTSDAARNITSPITNTSNGVRNTITYYAPITATAKISSNASNPSFVSNSGVVTVNLETNHNTTISNAVVGGYNAVTNGANTLTPYLTYTIPSNESTLSQGTLNFNCNVIDVAGNVLTVTDTPGSVVIYDKDKPTVSIVPDLSSFINKEITYTVTISDANIEANYITIAVTTDGSTVIYPVTYSDIISSGGSTVSKEITLSKDAEYLIEVTARDKADNTAEPKTVRVTIDTINPVINVVGIDLNTPKTYKKGQILGDFFDITEKNVKDIVCTVTDSKGNVQDWSLDKPITEDMDGRQTFTLQVTDLAGNTSNVITYDFYIDNTKPKFVISDDITNTSLNTSIMDTFISDMKINISLEDIRIGDNGLDRFTSAKLIKPDNTEINLLGSDATKAILFELNSSNFEDGEYKLILSAIDDMGNDTGETVYTFEFKDKSIFVKFFENKGLFYTSVAIAGVLIIAGIVIIIKKKKKDQSNN